MQSCDLLDFSVVTVLGVEIGFSVARLIRGFEGLCGLLSWGRLCSDCGAC